MTNDLKVSILVLSMNSLGDLKECFQSVIDQDYDNMKIRLIDNASTDDSVNYIRKKYPTVDIEVYEKNLGYSGAYNLALSKDFSEGYDYCLLLNSDVILEKDCVRKMINTAEEKSLDKNTKAGLIQPVILLEEERDKVNTLGNAIHYLGYGYCENYKDKYIPPTADQVITSPSGAALLVSKEYFTNVGSLNEDFFMYNEDQNYAWRGLLLGYKHYLSADSVVYHKYEFKSHDFKFYHSEKNRLMMFFENYSFKTITILLPIFFINEALIFFYAIIAGWGVKKIKSWIYFLTHLPQIKIVRNRVQRTRTVSDKEIFSHFRHKFVFAPVDSFLIKYLVNPFFSVYYKTAKLIV